MKKSKAVKIDISPNYPLFKPGDAVKHEGTGEVGRIIDCFWHPVLEEWDYYVLFWGSESVFPAPWPKNSAQMEEAIRESYRLRYFDTSLSKYKMSAEDFNPHRE